VSESQLYLQIAVWSQIVSSIVFIGLLIYMWNRWLMPVVLAAQERSNRQIAEAERHRDEVKGALTALRQEIDTARHDAALIGERATRRAQHERELLLQEATEVGERALADAGRELERARTAARHRLRDEILARALQLAREDAALKIGPEFDMRFVDRVTGELEHAANG
jgi:F0F1-type ATP synthase membrane subunit b/b'